MIAEFALILPVLIYLLLGTFEFGMGWRARSDLQSAVRLTVRTSSNLGNNGLADWSAVLAFKSNMLRVPNVAIDYLIIFEGLTAPSSTSVVPAACLTLAESLAVTAVGRQGVAGTCNIYTRQMITNTVSSSPSYNCTANSTPAAAWDGLWCPRARFSSIASNGGNGPDAIGVYAKFRYTTYTRLVGSQITMTDQMFGRLEPR